MLLVGASAPLGETTMLLLLLPLPASLCMLPGVTLMGQRSMAWMLLLLVHLLHAISLVLMRSHTSGAVDTCQANGYPHLVALFRPAKYITALLLPHTYAAGACRGSG